MKPCPHCGGANADGHRFCQHCGRPLEHVPSADSTVRWTGQPLGAKGEMRRATPLDLLFARKSRVVIGRAPDCDVCLLHPMVSRHHALLERLPDGRLRLSDLGSVNGVSVGTQRIAEPVVVREREQVGIGPFLFSLVGGVIHTVDSSRSLRLEARGLEKAVRLPGGKVRKLLDGINLAVEPGEFVSLLGPSGSGKSTLMDCLNGRRRATGGHVLANGEDFYRHFDSFRQSLGYVPQRDIVHTQLSVYKALYYTARLRLPTDTGPTELAARIEEVIQQMELGPHRDTLVGHLSGGQIKRVSLGAELLARPCLLYIDEATSGLDAGTEARMMRLFRQLADEGKSLLCITHNVDNVDRCHLVLVLARGKLVFFGPPQEAPAYFGVRRLGEIYDSLAAKDLEAWEERFGASDYYQKYVAGRLNDFLREAPAAPAVPLRAEARLAGDGASGSLVLGEGGPLARPKRPPVWHQFRVLTGRYVELLWGDRRSLRLLLLQAPVVAAIILAAFVGKPYEGKLPVTRRLSEDEFRLLQVFHGLNRMLDDPGADPAAAGPLTRLRFTVKDPDTAVPETLNGVDLVRKLRRASEKDLAKIEVAFDRDGKETTLTGAQLLHLQKTLHDSGLTDQLLKAQAQKLPVVPAGEMTDPRYTYMLLFILVIIVLWFGCNNAAKEIVKEEAIYGRERAVNLGILPYLASKFLVLGLITVVQALTLMLIIYGALQALHLADAGYQRPPPEYCLAYLPQFGVLALLGLTGVALGLLLSACVSNPDRANALLPYVLIPQIILGGGIMPIKEGPLFWLAAVFSPVYWAYRAAHLGTSKLPDYFPFHTNYPDNAWLGCGVMAAETAVLLLLTAWFLRQKDVNKA